MPRGQRFVRGRSRGGHSRRGDYRPPRDSHDRDQRRRSDVYPGQARDFEVRRERGVADPRREADGHPRYRQVTSNYHRPRSDDVQSGEGSRRQYSDGNRSQVSGPSQSNWTRWNRNSGAVRAPETVSTSRPTSVSMVGQTSVSVVGPSTTNVPTVGQTTPAQDEAVVSMLHQIFDLANIEKIRERVYHPSNRVEPFNQALLMERCLRDIGSRMARQGLSASAPSASLGAPVQVTRAVPAQPAASASIAVAPVPAAAPSSQPSGQTAPRQIYGVAQEEAEFRQARREYATSQRKPQLLPSRPTQARSGYSMTQPDKWTVVRSKKSKKMPTRSMPEEKQVPRKEGHSSSSTAKMPVKRRAPEPSKEDEVPKKHKRRPACFMKSCGKPQSHMRRHVIGRHLPEGFMTWVEMSNEVRMESIVNFTTTIQNLLGCKTLDDLITKIRKDRLYPDPKKIIIATTDEDRGLMREFNRWVKKEDLTVTPEVSPPNCVASLAHWRLAAFVLSQIGEERVQVKNPNFEVKITGLGESASETTATLTVKKVREPTQSSDRKVEFVAGQKNVLKKTVLAQVQEATASAQSAPTEEPMELDLETEQNVSEVPDADELCRQVDEVLAQNQPSTSSSATSQVTETSVLAMPESEGHTPPPTFRPYQPPVMTSTEIINQLLDGTMCMDRFMSVKVREEKWEDPPQPTFKEVLIKPPPKPILPPRMEDIGERYGDREWEQRKQRLLSCDESQKIGFVDSHLHLDKIRAVAGFSALQSILNNGPMPQTPVRLQHAVCNFCHGVPSREDMVVYKRDHRLSFTYGVHPKEAKYVSQRQLDMVKSAVEKDPRCVGIGEMGMEYSEGYSKFNDHQIRVLKDLLRFYVDKKLWSKVLVIHCREGDNKSRDASDMCLAVMSSVLKDDVAKNSRIHRHCYNGGVREMIKWRDSFPSVMFGFTALILRRERPIEVDDVIKQLPMEKILLETDSPYLKAPEHLSNRFNSPYGIEAIARRVAELKGLGLAEVLTKTSENAARLYGLK